MTELEKMQRAKMYIDKLADGIDPLTDTPIRDDSVLNQVRISRCLFYVSDILSRVIDNGGEVGRKIAVKELPFAASPEQLASVEISEEPVGVSIITKRISAVIDDGVKKPSAMHISAWLVSTGYLQENIRSGKKERVPTERGKMLGIYTVEGTNTQGITYRKNLYPAAAQRFIVENIVRIEEETAAAKE